MRLRMQPAEPRALEAQLSELDVKISCALDLATEVGFASLAPEMFAEPETPRERARFGRDPGAIRTRDPQLRQLRRLLRRVRGCTPLSREVATSGG
jgi:hypothetical protein